MAEPIDIGDELRINMTWSVGGVPTDPTTVTLRVRKPDGTATDYPYSPSSGIIVHDSAGVYHAPLIPDASGLWRLKSTGTGAAAGVKQVTFYVQEDRTL